MQQYAAILIAFAILLSINSHQASSVMWLVAGVTALSHVATRPLQRAAAWSEAVLVTTATRGVVGSSV